MYTYIHTIQEPLMIIHLLHIFLEMRLLVGGWWLLSWLKKEAQKRQIAGDRNLAINMPLVLQSGNHLSLIYQLENKTFSPHYLSNFFFEDIPFQPESGHLQCNVLASRNPPRILCVIPILLYHYLFIPSFFI